MHEHFVCCMNACREDFLKNIVNSGILPEKILQNQHWKSYKFCLQHGKYYKKILSHMKIAMQHGKICLKHVKSSMLHTKFCLKTTIDSLKKRFQKLSLRQDFSFLSFCMKTLKCVFQNPGKSVWQHTKSFKTCMQFQPGHQGRGVKCLLGVVLGCWK